MIQGPKDEVRGSVKIVNGGVEKLQCGKCGSDLEEGFLIDNVWATTTVATWIPGRPEYNLFGGVRARGRKQRKVSAFRCTKCGRLELYAL